MYRGGTTMSFLISWSAANNEGLFLDKSAKSSPCQVKCPNQNQGSQLLQAVRYYYYSDCIICSFQRQRFYVQLSVCLKLKAEKQWGFGSQSLPGPTLHLSRLFNCSHPLSADRPDDGGGPGRGIRNIRLERALHFSGGAVWKIFLAFGGQAPWNNLNLAKKPGQRDLPVFYVTYMIFEKSILTIGAEIFSVRSPNPLAPGSDIQIHIIWGTQIHFLRQIPSPS